MAVSVAMGQQFDLSIAATDQPAIARDSVGRSDSVSELPGREPPEQTESSSDDQSNKDGSDSDRKPSGADEGSDKKDAKQEKAEGKQGSDVSNKGETSDAKMSSAKKPEATGPIVALKGAKILTQADAGIIDDGIVLIQDGKILEVGADIEIPESAEQIELAGYTLSPGLIDARSVYGVAGERQAVSNGSSIALDGFDVYDEDHSALLSEGVTAAYIQPYNTSLIGGVGSVVSVSSSRSMEDRILKRVAAAQAALKNPSASIRAHYADYGRLVKVLEAVGAYKKKWDEYNEYQEKKKKEDAKKAAAKKNAAKGKDKKSSSKETKKSDDKSSDKKEKDAKGSDSEKKQTVSSRRREAMKRFLAARRKAAGQDSSKSDETSKTKGDDKEKKAPKKPDVNPVYERWVPVLKGEVALHIETHSSDDTSNALKLSEKFEDISLVLTGLSDVRSANELIADSRLPIVLGPWLDSERTAIDDEYRVLNWSEQFFEHEGLVVIGSFANSTLGSKTLRHQAAVAVAAGMPRDQAFNAITSNAARLLGVDNKIGSIEKGKRADLIVMTGHPLDATAAVAHAFVAGEHVYESDQVPSVSSGVSPQFSFQALPAQLPQAYVIRSDRVLSVDGQWKPAAFVVRRGKIKRMMGRDEPADPKLKQFDLGAMAISPGLVSSHTSLGVSADLSQSSGSDASNVTTADVFSSRLTAAKRLTDGGFTTALFSPPSSNTLSGTAAWIQLADEYQVIAAESLGATFPKLALIGSARSANKFPASLDGQLDLINTILDGNMIEDRLYLPSRVAKVIAEQRRSALVDVVSGGNSVLIHASTDSEIHSALQLAEDRKLKSVIVFANELRPYLGRITEIGAAVVIRPVRSNDFQWFVDDIVATIEAEIPVAIAGESPMDIRSTAAELVRNGVDSKVARNMLTQPIEHLTPDDPTGLAVGSRADFVVWSDDFLNLSALPVSVVSAGRSVDRLPSTQRLLDRLSEAAEKADMDRSSREDEPEEMADNLDDVRSAVTATE